MVHASVPVAREGGGERVLLQLLQGGGPIRSFLVGRRQAFPA